VRRSAETVPGRAILAPVITEPLDLTPLDLTPRNWDCLRCGETHPMRFRSVCPRCRDELRTNFQREAKDVAVADYEPKMNVTPNAIATKD
jgi:hypothetical protein